MKKYFKKTLNTEQLKRKIFSEKKKNNKPTKVNLNTIEFELVGKKLERLKILFDKETLELKGWETNDAYSNKVNFEINNLVINNQIVDNFFKIPQEKDL